MQGREENTCENYEIVVAGEYEKSKEEAKEILVSEERTHGLIEKALSLCNRLSRIPQIGVIFEDIPLLCMCVNDYVKKRYKEIPLASVLTIAGALLYLVNPLDVIPDCIPVIGYLDDGFVFRIALRAVHNDLNAYKEWKGSAINEEFAW